MAENKGKPEQEQHRGTKSERGIEKDDAGIDARGTKAEHGIERESESKPLQDVNRFESKLAPHTEYVDADGHGLQQEFDNLNWTQEQLNELEKQESPYGVEYRATLEPREWETSLDQQGEVYQNKHLRELKNEGADPAPSSEKLEPTESMPAAENAYPPFNYDELKNETPDITRAPMELDDAEDWDEPEDRRNEADSDDDDEDDEED